MTHKMLVGSVLLTVGLAVSLAVASLTEAQQFKLTSPDIKPNGVIAEEQVFNGFGCSGKNASPALAWSGAPKGTKSFALLVHDPDAPTGGAGWWHWLVVNIPADAKELARDAGDPAAGKAPAEALQTRTDFGQPGWGGPCPPPGDKPHRYTFTLHALKTDKLDLPQDASAAMVGYNINGNTIAKASFTVRYGR